MNSIDGFRLSYSAADAKKLLIFLLSIDLLLVMVYILTRFAVPPSLGLRNLFDLDREVSIPTWYSSAQLTAVGVTLLLQARKSKPVRAFLVILALGFIFLSMDETAEIHEDLSHAAAQLKLSWIAGREYLVWMTAYSAIGVAVLLIGFRSALVIWHNFRREALWVVVGGVIFVTGGIGIEIVTHILVRYGITARFLLAVTVEEFCEMSGVSIMLYGFMLLGLGLDAEYSA